MNLNKIHENSRRDVDRALVYNPHSDPNLRIIKTTLGYDVWINPVLKDLSVKTKDYDAGVLVFAGDVFHQIIDDLMNSPMAIPEYGPARIFEENQREQGSKSPLVFDIEGLESIATTMNYDLRLNEDKGQLIVRATEYPAGTLILKYDFLDGLNRRLRKT